jgi:hypothetical protein
MLIFPQKDAKTVGAFYAVQMYIRWVALRNLGPIDEANQKPTPGN